MIIRNYEEIEKFARRHATARPAFNRWRRIAEVVIWENFEDVKRDFPAADKYKALTHAEYDKEKWKKDCHQN